MYAFYELVAENAPILWVILIVVCIIFVFQMIRILKKTKRIKFEEIDVPANIWFYSMLVNMEIGIEKATYDKLMHYFMNYLYKKYQISREDLKTQSVFDLVSSKEDRQDVLDLYGDIWNSLEDLKESGRDDIVKYIKTIKFYFNKENLDGWISARNYNKQCNDC